MQLTSRNEGTTSALENHQKTKVRERMEQNFGLFKRAANGRLSAKTRCCHLHPNQLAILVAPEMHIPLMNSIQF